MFVHIFFNFIFQLFAFNKDFIYLFGREGEREREKHQLWLPHAHPSLGTWPTTQACALDWKLNRRPFGSIRRWVLDPLSHTSQGCIQYYWEQDSNSSKRKSFFAESLLERLHPIGSPCCSVTLRPSQTSFWAPKDTTPGKEHIFKFFSMYMLLYSFNLSCYICP